MNVPALPSLKTSCESTVAVADAEKLDASVYSGPIPAPSGGPSETTTSATRRPSDRQISVPGCTLAGSFAQTKTPPKGAIARSNAKVLGRKGNGPPDGPEVIRYVKSAWLPTIGVVAAEESPVPEVKVPTQPSLSATAGTISSRSMSHTRVFGSGEGALEMMLSRTQAR